MSKYYKIISLFFVMLFVQHMYADNVKETFVKIVQDFLVRTNYALQYKSFLYTNTGEEIKLVNGDAIVLRNDLTLFTQTDDMIYIINTEGSLKVNFKSKKMAYSSQPLSKEEKEKLVADLNEKSYDILLKKIEKCDSVTINTINGYNVFSTYLDGAEYIKTECWVDQNNHIKEIRYFFSGGDYVYQKIVYQDYKVDDVNALVSFSNYFSIKENKVVLTEKYKDYAFFVK